MSYMRAGTILNVDLTTGKVSRESTSAYQDLFVGGRGINTKIVYDRVSPEVNALEPGNVIAFGTGPFTGTAVPGSGRTNVEAKSPVTGFNGKSNIGGFWAPELKYAGYDNLVVVGRSSKPVYIAIDNDNVEIRDASHLWGKNTYETPVAIRKELGEPNAQVLSIGPAGENLVAYATIMTKVGDGAGRTGMGAVMGSKNLQAIAVRGTKGVSVADMKRFLEICDETLQTLTTGAYSEKYEKWSHIGTTHMAYSTDPTTGFRNAVWGNHQATYWERQDEVDWLPLWQEHGDARTGCFNCPIRCMEHYDIPGLGPLVASCNEYAGLSFYLRNADLMLWYENCSQCQRYGLDVLSVGGMIAWAIELYEKGIITKEDTDGIPLAWGDRDTIIQLTEKIARREGFGDVLASNARDAAAKIGQGSEEYLMHNRGLILPITNQMNVRSRAISTAAGVRGDYLQDFAVGGAFDDFERIDKWSKTHVEGKMARSILEAYFEKHGGNISEFSLLSYEARGALAALGAKLFAFTDTLGQCKWHTPAESEPVGIELQAKLLTAGEGSERSVEELIDVGARVVNVERAFAAREGLTREQDRLPKRFFTRPMPGLWPDDILDLAKFEQMKDEYYEAMGWDVKTGIPSRKTLNSLKLSDVATDLERRSKLPKEKGAASLLEDPSREKEDERKA